MSPYKQKGEVLFNQRGNCEIVLKEQELEQPTPRWKEARGPIEEGTNWERNAKEKRCAEGNQRSTSDAPRGNSPSKKKNELPGPLTQQMQPYGNLAFTIIKRKTKIHVLEKQVAILPRGSRRVKKEGEVNYRIKKNTTHHNGGPEPETSFPNVRWSCTTAKKSEIIESF